VIKYSHISTFYDCLANRTGTNLTNPKSVSLKVNDNTNYCFKHLTSPENPTTKIKQDRRTRRESVPKQEKVCESVPKLEKVCESVPKLEKV